MGLSRRYTLTIASKLLRTTLLRLSHDFNGHVGVKKVKAILNRLYTLPGLLEDVLKWCKSREVCQKHKIAGERKAELMVRPVITEPFESVAFDIVGPFPRSKSGYKYICMASRYPDAIPLKSVTAEDVADGMLDIFSRTGLLLANSLVIIPTVCLLLLVDRSSFSSLT